MKTKVNDSQNIKSKWVLPRFNDLLNKDKRTFLKLLYKNIIIYHGLSV